MAEIRLGHHALIRRLGEGGMGEVYLARHLATGAIVALKRLRPDALTDGCDLSHEFQVLTRLRHPNIVKVHEFGRVADGTAWYTMEYVVGQSAEGLERLEGEALAFVAAEVASGLEALHAEGIVHGDLKPSNVIVSLGASNEGPYPAKPQAVHIVDFGLAGGLGSAAAERLGTTGYAAPELTRGGIPSQASDLYSLGASLYRLTSGRLAFEGSTRIERLQHQANGPPPAGPLEARQAPPALVHLILRLMAVNPIDRPRSAREVRLELQERLPGARRALSTRLGTTVFVGREPELANMEGWAERSEPRLFVLAGEAGSGRTALLDAFATRSALVGRSVARLDAVDCPTRGSLLDALVRHMSTLLGTESTIASSEPSSLEIEDWSRALAALTSPAAETEQKTIIILIDNADALLPDARAFLRRLALEPRVSLRILQVRSAPQPLDPDEVPLHLAGHVRVMSVEPLDDDQIARLVGARLGGSPPRAFLSRIVSLSGGHPGLVVELLHCAAISGVLHEGDEGFRVDEGGLAALDVPRDFASARLRRLHDAPAEVQDLALAMAVCGRRVGGDELRMLLPDLTDAVVQELQSLGLARAGPDGRLGLSMPSLAGALCSRDPARTARLHRAALTFPGLCARDRFEHHRGSGDITGALDCAETAWAEASDTAPAAAAAMLAEASGPALAALWRDRAAEQAWQRGRYDESARHLECAVGFFGESTASRLERLASSLFRAGQLGDVASPIQEGLSRDPSPRIRGRLLVTESARCHALGDAPRALVAIEEAIALCHEAGDFEGEAHAALTASSVLLALDRAEEAGVRAEEAVTLYGRCRQSLGQARAGLARGLTLRRLGQIEAAEMAYLQALERAKDGASRMGIEECHLKLAQLYGDLGRGAECQRAYEAALRIALEDGRGRGVALATLNLAQFEGASGRPAEAVRLARRAIRLSRAYLPSHESFAWRSLAQARRALGHLREAQRAAERAMTLASETVSSSEGRTWCRIELGRVLLECDRWPEALQVAETEWRGTSNWNPADAILEVVAGRAALWTGDRRRAAEAVRRVGPWLERKSHPLAAAFLAQLRAELALAEGRVAQADEMFAAALGGFESIPAPHERAMAFYDAARLANSARADARVPVGDWLRQAIAILGALGDRRRRVRAVELEADWLRRQLNRSRWEVESGLLEKVGRLLQSLTNYAELTDRAMRLVVEQFDAERGVLLVEDEGTGRLEPVAQCGASDATSEREALEYSRMLVSRVIAEGTSILVDDATLDGKAASESARRLRLRAMLCVPMFQHGRVVGAVYLDSRRVGVFGDADRQQLEGFSQYMASALESSRVAERLTHENQALRQEMVARTRAGLVGSSLVLQRLLPRIEQAARSQAIVLIGGETGTGKGVVAKMIHELSPRSRGPFVSVNCSSFTKETLPGEIFGVGKRAFSQVDERPGRFQMAHRGTLFLDEIGDMPPEQQTVLLSVLEDGKVMPVGGREPIPVDVRVIAASNHDLEAQVEAKAFRRDLYFRLKVLTIDLPTLRQRKGDIPELALHFATQFAARSGRAVPELSDDFLADLMRRDWPGNVRELENWIERVMVTTEADVLHAEAERRDLFDPAPRSPRNRKFDDQVNNFRRRLLLDALRHSGGNQSRAAKDLGLSEATFRNWLTRLGIPRKKLRI
jgi:Nif-specific regulatory protein